MGEKKNTSGKKKKGQSNNFYMGEETTKSFILYEHLNKEAHRQREEQLKHHGIKRKKVSEGKEDGSQPKHKRRKLEKQVNEKKDELIVMTSDGMMNVDVVKKNKQILT